MERHELHFKFKLSPRKISFRYWSNNRSLLRRNPSSVALEPIPVVGQHKKGTLRGGLEFEIIGHQLGPEIVGFNPYKGLAKKMTNVNLLVVPFLAGEHHGNSSPGLSVL